MMTETRGLIELYMGLDHLRRTAEKEGEPLDGERAVAYAKAIMKTLSDLLSTEEGRNEFRSLWNLMKVLEKFAELMSAPESMNKIIEAQLPPEWVEALGKDEEL